MVVVFLVILLLKLKKSANKHKDLNNPVIKAVRSVRHRGLQKVAKSLHNKINGIPELSGKAAKELKDVVNDHQKVKEL